MSVMSVMPSPASRRPRGRAITALAAVDSVLAVLAPVTASAAAPPSPVARRRPPSPAAATAAPGGRSYGCPDRPQRPPYNGTMSGAPSRAASAVRSSGWRCDSRSASTRFS